MDLKMLQAAKMGHGRRARLRRLMLQRNRKLRVCADTLWLLNDVFIAAQQEDTRRGECESLVGW
jgi:hypothetical protein